MKQQILVIENDLAIYQTIRNHLTSDTTETKHVLSTSEVLAHVVKCKCCLVIMDLQLPDIDRMEMIRVIRIIRQIPILAITDPLETAEKIALFHAGMDAYVEKPFEADVCAAQADALIRLHQRPRCDPHRTPQLSFGTSLVIIPPYRQAFVDGQLLELTRKEFNLLYYFAQHPYQVFSRDQLYAQVWDNNFEYGGDDTVKVHINTLRRKLTILGENIIENVWGVGYRFNPPDIGHES